MKNNEIVTVKPMKILEAAVKELANGGSEWNHSAEFELFVESLVAWRFFRPDFTGEEDPIVWYQEIVSDLLYRNWSHNCIGWTRYGVRPEVAKAYICKEGGVSALCGFIDILAGKYADLERTLK